MSITKQSIIDKIEIVSKFNIIQVRVSNQVLEDGIVIAENYNRYCVKPGQTSTDSKVAAVIAAVHTQDVIDSYQAHLAAQND